MEGIITRYHVAVPAHHAETQPPPPCRLEIGSNQILKLESKLKPIDKSFVSVLQTVLWLSGMCPNFGLSIKWWTKE